MKIAVLGAGRMGSLYGARLAHAGHDVVLFDCWREHVDAIRRDGIRLEGFGDSIVEKVRATADPADIGIADFAIILVDTNGTADVATIAADILADDGFVVTLQNGVGNIEALTAALGRERVLAGLSYDSADLIAPGAVRHTHKAHTLLGEVDGGISGRLAMLDGVLAGAGFDVQVVDDIIGQIWAKFIHNCGINAISAVTGMRCGDIVRNPATDAFQSLVLDEVIAVVTGKGIVVPEDDPLAHVKDFCWTKFNKPSTLQHVENGIITEVDSLNGAVVREGRALGIPTPYNESLVLLLKGLEAVNHRKHHEPEPDYSQLEADAKRQPRQV